MGKTHNPTEIFDVALPCGDSIKIRRDKLEDLSRTGDWRTLCYGHCKRYDLYRLFFECDTLNAALPLKGIRTAISGKEPF